jgi:two-component system NarL family sensor kinase
VQKRSEPAVLSAIADALNSSPTVHAALDRTLKVVADLLNLTTGWVWLIDRDSDHMYSAASRNLPPYLQEPERMTGGWCMCINEFREGTLEARNIDVLECTRLRPAVKARQTDLTSGIAHHATIPLSFQGKPLGILNLTAPNMRRLSKEELHLLSTIGLQVGVAIERARLAEESAILARADERTRLAREIHDTLAQGLTALTLQIETALQNVGRDPDRVRERLEKALATARANLDEARRSVENLRAGALAGKPLAQALTSLAREFTSESGIPVGFETKGACELPLPVEAELYRIAQQALMNVGQHANAHAVRLALVCTKKAATLTIADDGHGFNTRRVPDGHHGIEGMRERASVAGGALRIASTAKGTTVTVRVPR